MRRHRSVTETQRFMDKINASQRNVLWPDTLRNVTAVDKFLWRGSPDAPLVQRVGAWLFGLMLITAGFFMLDYFGSARWLLFIPLAFLLLGAKVFRNGFRRRSNLARPTRN
jgi:hypothetical protein